MQDIIRGSGRMSQPQKTRRQKLEELVAQNPDEAFARYALAIECSNTGDTEAAVLHFQELLRRHPSYLTGWFQFGQFLARSGHIEEARTALHRGMEAATAAGDSHAREEMQAALDSLG
jgi:tetratricopeptide (TPR) repeat protein